MYNMNLPQIWLSVLQLHICGYNIFLNQVPFSLIRVGLCQTTKEFITISLIWMNSCNAQSLSFSLSEVSIIAFHAVTMCWWCDWQDEMKLQGQVVTEFRGGIRELLHNAGGDAVSLGGSYGLACLPTSLRNGTTWRKEGYNQVEVASSTIIKEHTHMHTHLHTYTHVHTHTPLAWLVWRFKLHAWLLTRFK